ncbi:MAG: hypothetical protein ABIU54_00830 [Candidatus Eisenbacteria bacterium]
MRLTNFKLDSGVELSGLGALWDLHNCVDFSGLEILPDEGAAKMRWTVMTESPFREQGFNGNNPARSCAIRFDEVTTILIRRVMDGSGPADARTLNDLRLVMSPENTPLEVSRAGIRIPATDGQGNMLFEFIDGFDIEIAASTATLEADEDEKGYGES